MVMGSLGWTGRHPRLMPVCESSARDRGIGDGGPCSPGGRLAVLPDAQPVRRLRPGRRAEAGVDDPEVVTRLRQRAGDVEAVGRRLRDECGARERLVEFERGDGLGLVARDIECRAIELRPSPKVRSAPPVSMAVAEPLTGSTRKRPPFTDCTTMSAPSAATIAVDIEGVLLVDEVAADAASVAAAPGSGSEPSAARGMTPSLRDVRVSDEDGVAREGQVVEESRPRRYRCPGGRRCRPHRHAPHR